MRKAAIVIGIVILVVIIAGAIFLATFNVNNYRGRIQSELENRLGRQVQLGDMHLSVFPPSFQVNNLSIADDARFNDPNPFVKASQLNVSVKLLPLLHKDVQIDSLTLQRPTVELIKNQQGVWNFSTLGNNPEAAQPPAHPAQPQKPGQKPTAQQPAKPAPSQPEQQGGASNFSLSELSIQDGQVALTDHQAGHPRAVYDHIDLTLNNFAPDQPFSLALAAHLPGPGKQEVRLDGKGGPLAQGDPAATPFHGTLNLDGVWISGVSKFLNNPALANTDGSLTGQTKIDSDSGKLGANGGFTIQNAKVHGVDVGYPIDLRYNLADDLKTDLLNVQSATVKLGQTPVNLSGVVNMKPTPMQLNVNVKADNVSIAEMTRLASAFGVAFSPNTTVNGQASANIHATGPADKPALNGTLSARNVQATGKDIPQPVQIPAVNFQLTPQQVRSDNFNIISDKTTVTSNVAVTNYTSSNPLIAANLMAPNAQLPAILSMARAWGVTALDKVSGLGTMNLNMHLTGPVKTLTSADVMRALNGGVNVNFNNVRYNGADISHQLAGIAGFLGAGKPGQNDQGFTNILKMTGSIPITNGIAQTNNLQAQLDIANLGITGTANLVTQALNLRINAVMSQNTSKQVGGTNIGGFMNTALANNQGELVIPVLVTGTFQNPKFAPDVQSVAQMKLKGLLPNSDNPAGAVSGVLGGLLGQKGAKPGQAGQPQQPQNNPSNAVQQILGGFRGGKKQQKPNQQQPPPK